MKKIKITLDNWHYSCGDGCCDMFGTKLYLNDEELEHPTPNQTNNYLGDDVENALKAVLLKLGYEVEIELKYEE